MMAFRIRSKCVNVEQNEYESKENLYREHLAKIAKDKDRDMWRYFYWDAFHDGYIKKISFWDAPGDITLHISCPNIKKRKGDSFDYIKPIDFECHFRSVVFFHIEHDNPEELIYEQHNRFLPLFRD